MLLPCPPRAPLHSHVENRLLVPVLTTVPDRQGVVTPLQVKLLEGQLDHLGREQGLGRGQGLPGETPTALKTEGSSCPHAQSARDITPHNPQSKLSVSMPPF